MILWSEIKHVAHRFDWLCFYDHDVFIGAAQHCTGVDLFGFLDDFADCVCRVGGDDTAAQSFGKMGATTSTQCHTQSIKRF